MVEEGGGGVDVVWFVVEEVESVVGVVGEEVVFDVVVEYLCGEVVLVEYLVDFG